MSAYDFWQFWRNTEDADVERFLKLYTTHCRWPRSRRLAALGGAEINEAKKILATEVTAMLHGREAAEAAAETARKTFEEGALAADLPSVAVARGRARGRSRRAHRLRQGGPRALDRRGAAAGQGWRPARQ
jgi:tyrosyl-tRNA synthetase